MRPDQQPGKRPNKLNALIDLCQHLGQRLVVWGMRILTAVDVDKSEILKMWRRSQQRRLTAILIVLPILAIFLGLVVLEPSSQKPNQALIPTRLFADPPSALSSPVCSEIRGVWITNVASSVLFAPWGIVRAVHQLADLHFNTVYPVVWNRGQTFYHSPTLKQTTGYAIAPVMALVHPTEDPLAEIVRVGHRENMRVIPWFEYGFMVPLNAKLARQHPDWLTWRHNASRRLYDDSFVEGPAKEPVENPIENPAEGTIDGSREEKRSQKKSGLFSRLLSSGAPSALAWLNPLHPEVQSLVLNLVEEVVSQYEVDGIQFDDHFSLPVEFGYDPYTVSLYQAEHQGQSPPADAADEAWIRWRADKFSEFVGAVHARVKAVCPSCLFSLSPNPAKFAYRFHLQDWRAWVKNGWIDELVVQVYRDDLDKFESELAKDILQSTMDKIPVSIGILTGTWRRPIAFDQIKAQVISSRDHHFSGVTFFYWDTLWSYFTPESPQQRRQNFRALLADDTTVVLAPK
ncbi:MAG: family 10 glycosylhydrolase [Phormidesmis sp.]